MLTKSLVGAELFSLEEDQLLEGEFLDEEGSFGVGRVVSVVVLSGIFQVVFRSGGGPGGGDEEEGKNKCL